MFFASLFSSALYAVELYLLSRDTVVMLASRMKGRTSFPICFRSSMTKIDKFSPCLKSSASLFNRSPLRLGNKAYSLSKVSSYALTCFKKSLYQALVSAPSESIMLFQFFLVSISLQSSFVFHISRPSFHKRSDH